MLTTNQGEACLARPGAASLGPTRRHLLAPTRRST